MHHHTTREAFDEFVLLGECPHCSTYEEECKDCYAKFHIVVKVSVGSLFTSKVGRDFAPLLGFPLYDGDGDTVCLEPRFGTFDELEELFSLFGALKLGLATFLTHPADSRAAITIDGHLEGH